MTQFLLKTTNSKFSPQATTISEASERHQRTEKVMIKPDYDSWRTPQHHQYEPNLPQQQQQTPFFQHKLTKINSQIEVIEGSISEINQNSQNERTSQVQYVIDMNEEQLHPMILSNINNLRPGINKLMYLRLRNALAEIRQVQFQLLEYLQDEKKFMEDFHQKLCLDIEDFMTEYLLKIMNNHNVAEINQLKSQNQILRQRIDRRETEYQHMSRELQSIRNSLEQKQKQVKPNKTQSLQNQCSRCRQISSKISSVVTSQKKQQVQIERLTIENEKLQQHIFDIQQKIAGIDLEVQRRLKEKMLILNQYKNNQHQKEMQQLRLQLKEMKIKQKDLQLTVQKHEQIDLRLINLEEKERNLRKYQISLIEIQKESEELKQNNYERQHQILQAEQNLSKKINEIRIKEKELSEWQAELTLKASEVRNTAFEAPNIQLSSQIKVSRQMSLKSFGRSPQNIHEQLQYNIPHRIKTQQNQLEYSDVYQAQRQMKLSSSKQLKRVIIANKYLQNDAKNKDFYNKFAKNTSFSTINYNEKREVSPSHMIMQPRQRIIQYGKNGHNTSHYLDLSKRSKHSLNKSMKSIYHHPSATNTSKLQTQSQHFSSLGNKLQRLREQIKRQISSIK